MSDLIDKDKIEKLVVDAISRYLDEDYLRGFIAKVVSSALNDRADYYGNETVIEKKLKEKVREIAMQELEKELDKNKERIRKAVKKILEEKGLDIIIERISRSSAQKIAEAIQIEAWLEE
ncbi:MAG: hypothetical protein KatS3mg101_1010 [Patescibacteria group bacterium]|nr:MAG: hypothetical protein KatS3mg101_1010 [Patescibacteria group bacterium]